MVEGSILKDMGSYKNKIVSAFINSDEICELLFNKEPYTEEDVERFKQIKQLKEKGIQLKGIRSMLDLETESGMMKLPAADFSQSNLSFETGKEEKAGR